MRRVAFVAAVASALVLTACGGGGGGGAADSPSSMTQQPPPVVDVDRLDFPLTGFKCSDHYGEGTDCDLYRQDTFAQDNIPTYQIDALPKRTRESDGQHMPVYHDDSQLFGIGVHDWGENQRRIFVGADRGESVSAIPTVGTWGTTAIRYGSIRDGAKVTELRAYLSDMLEPKVERYETAPTVHITGSPDALSTADQVNWVVAAVELVNTALPPHARMTVADSQPGESPLISVKFLPSDEFEPGIGGTTWNTHKSTGDRVEIASSLIHVNADAFSRDSHRHFVTLIAHELIHAVGFGHASPSFDTIMEATGQIYQAWQGFGAGGTRMEPDFSCGYRNCFTPVHEDLADIPMPMSLLYPLDREALQIIYSRLESGSDPQEWGAWSSTSLHIAGNGEHANFGVALRNELLEPWAHGYMPEMDLASNRTLSGNAAWDGALLGLTQDAAAVAGDASISVNLASMTGRANFTSLETWTANAAPSEAGTGTQWLDGDLGYTITVTGNTFRETGGDAGRLTGIFTGQSHEGAAGTLERSDLTAAFGAER